jgi:hypothetical protein
LCRFVCFGVLSVVRWGAIVHFWDSSCRNARLCCTARVGCRRGCAYLAPVGRCVGLHCWQSKPTAAFFTSLSPLFSSSLPLLHYCSGSAATETCPCASTSGPTSCAGSSSTPPRSSGERPPPGIPRRRFPWLLGLLLGLGLRLDLRAAIFMMQDGHVQACPPASPCYTQHALHSPTPPTTHAHFSTQPPLACRCCRSREFLWQEGHTCFATQKEAETGGLCGCIMLLCGGKRGCAVPASRCLCQLPWASGRWLTSSSVGQPPLAWFDAWGGAHSALLSVLSASGG